MCMYVSATATPVVTSVSGVEDVSHTTSPPSAVVMASAGVCSSLFMQSCVFFVLKCKFTIFCHIILTHFIIRIIEIVYIFHTTLFIKIFSEVIYVCWLNFLPSLLPSSLHFMLFPLHLGIPQLK